MPTKLGQSQNDRLEILRPLPKRIFIQIALLILIFGLVVYLVTPKYDFYHQNIRRNRFSGKIEKYDADLDRWGTRKELQRLRESQSIHPRMELIDDLGILGTFEPEKPSLFKHFINEIKTLTKKEFIYALIAVLSFVLLIFLRIKRFLRNAPRQSMNGKDG